MIYTTNNKFKFRSPDFGYDDVDYACIVYPTGLVVDRYYVYWDSYGRSSPDTIGPSYSKDVTYTGEVMGNYANGSVGESYGIFDIDKIQFPLAEARRVLVLLQCVSCAFKW